MSTKVKKIEPKLSETPATNLDIESHPLLALREEVDTLFDRFFSNFTLGPFGRYGQELEPLRRIENTFAHFGKMTPYANVSETEKMFKVSLELPGWKEEDIDISLGNDMLVVSGERSEEKTEEGEDFHLMERRHGSVRRMFHIPPAVIVDKAVATFENGILNIEMPKKVDKEKAKLRKIEIKK